MTEKLWIAQGLVSRAPARIIEEASKLAPRWRWIEPRPGCGLDDKGKPVEGLAARDLHPLLAPGGAELPGRPGLQIEEARLFWPGASLHLLAGGAGATRCAFWSIGEAPRQEQQALIDTLGLACAAVRDVEAADIEPVLTRRDLERFGIKHSETLPGKLSVQAYRADGAVIAWTLGN